MKINSVFKYISLASMLTAAAASKAQSLVESAAQGASLERLNELLYRVAASKDSIAKKALVDTFVNKVKAGGHAIVEDSTVCFIYNGKAQRVSVPSDLNGWNPSLDTMKRLPGTNFFHLRKTLDPAARIEYKLIVDSTWVLDPFNRQQAIGGYGPNSEVWMPRYSPSKEIEYRPDIKHGVIDTLAFKSKALRRTHPVFVYTPPGYKTFRKPLPSIYVTDGGEYISLALMLNVLDNLIADKRIKPVIGIFIDPRTDGRTSQTSTRMTDYAMSDTFVHALLTDLQPKLLKKYRLSTKPEQTAIMGASLGGLIATYAACTHPEVFGLCAAQSPAYWYGDSSIFRVVGSASKMSGKFYIDTGTIRDTQTEASKMKSLLISKGCTVAYGEYPEGHNWVNWRARLGKMLTYFWGTVR